jgi:alkanesulfonate monooxygenase SsuD/methylene tetrahydromethanopterin reductase-like flavin-dependent oxidoreductase (luciferase family)
MIEIGVFNNGGADMHMTESGGLFVPDGSLDDVHASYQRVLIGQIRQGVLADELGFDYFFMTEHHFVQEGQEFSPNPIVVESAIAARTKRIRLGQMANILSWWHPLRLAEQVAMLDVISGGRAEFGIGRGYQPRENETFGWVYGSTVQDQERNRAYFEEALSIIIKAWTEPSFSHHGQFYSIPPTYTRWNHPQTIAYFGSPQAGRRLEQVVDPGPPDDNVQVPKVMASTTNLREISVFPHPVQRPYPQIWEPVQSERSLRYAAQHGVNAYTVPGPATFMKQNIEIYHEEAERAGWPDRLNRGRWKYGWDAERHRGYAVSRNVHVIKPGSTEKQQIENYKRKLQASFDYYGPFQPPTAFTPPGEKPHPLGRIDVERVVEGGVAMAGTPDRIVEQIMGLKDQGGFDDFCFTAVFECSGFRSEEIEEQMQRWTSEVMPVLRRECGGGPQFADSTVSLMPAAQAAPAAGD